MQKKIFTFFLTVSLFLFIGIGTVSATLIDFSEVSLFTPDPTIDGVSFFAGDGLANPWPNDTITDDSLSPGNPFLFSGVDDGTGNLPGLYDTFIGASASGFTFDTVTFDIGVLDGGLPNGSTFYVEALAGGTSVTSSSVTGIFAVSTYSSLSVSFATGFDTLHIYSAMDPSSAEGEIFEIDNFDFIQYDPGGGPGPDPIPEPGTMVLFGAGLMGFAALGRRRKKE